MLSRREFFDNIARSANPQRWREKRVTELVAVALKAAPGDWGPDEREETARAIETKLSYLSDDTLRQPHIRKYVQQIVRTKEMFYAARRAEEDYLRRQQDEFESME